MRCLIHSPNKQVSNRQRKRLRKDLPRKGEFPPCLVSCFTSSSLSSNLPHMMKKSCMCLMSSLCVLSTGEHSHSSQEKKKKLHCLNDIYFIVNKQNWVSLPIFLKAVLWTPYGWIICIFEGKGECEWESCHQILTLEVNLAVAVEMSPAIPVFWYRLCYEALPRQLNCWVPFLSIRGGPVVLSCLGH